jgi:hypothetical protein
MGPSTTASDAAARYERDGLLFPIPVLSDAEVERFRYACDHLEGLLGGKPRTIDVRQMHLHFPWACELATAPRVLDQVAAVLGPDLLIWATELFAKHPRDPGVAIGWHRDRDYMGFDSARSVTAWIALSPSHEDNGCLLAWPGPERREAAPGTPDAPPTSVVLAPGEMSLHDADILHGSRANRCDEKRVGFAVRFVEPTVRPRHGRPRMLLARGHAASDAYELVGPPEPGDEDLALRALRRSALQHFDAVLRNLADRRARAAETPPQEV